MNNISYGKVGEFPYYNIDSPHIHTRTQFNVVNLLSYKVPPIVNEYLIWSGNMEYDGDDYIFYVSNYGRYYISTIVGKTEIMVTEFPNYQEYLLVNIIKNIVKYNSYPIKLTNHMIDVVKFMGGKENNCIEVLYFIICLSQQMQEEFMPVIYNNIVENMSVNQKNRTQASYYYMMRTIFKEEIQHTLNSTQLDNCYIFEGKFAYYKETLPHLYSESQTNAFDNQTRYLRQLSDEDKNYCQDISEMKYPRLTIIKPSCKFSLLEYYEIENRKGNVITEDWCKLNRDNLLLPNYLPKNKIELIIEQTKNIIDSLAKRIAILEKKIFHVPKK
jgi:hypothetical protein